MYGELGKATWKSAVNQFASAFWVILVLALGVTSSKAPAQVGTLQPMDTPIPKEWHEPISGFLRDLGVSDIHSLVENTKRGPRGSIHHPDSITFRIEHNEACHEDVCLTVIGRIESRKFIPDVMFGAGKMTTQGDYAQQILGFRTFPLWFESSKGVVTLLESPHGWIVVPTAK